MPETNVVITNLRRERFCKITSGAISTLPAITHVAFGDGGVAHAGTADDPIPAAAGMDYIVGRFYLDPEDGKVYQCIRPGMADGETVNL